MNIKRTTQALLIFVLLCQKLMGAESPPRILHNDSSRCYRNAVLQCLASCSSFVEFFKKKKGSFVPGSVGGQFQAFLTEHLKGGPAWSPIGLQAAIDAVAPDKNVSQPTLGKKYQAGEAEDSPEFLKFLLGEFSIGQKSDFINAFNHLVKTEFSPVRSHYCFARSDSHSQEEPPITESVPLLPTLNGELTFNKCFENFFNHYKTNMFKCDNDCGAEPALWQETVKIHHLPRILFLALNSSSFTMGIPFPEILNPTKSLNPLIATISEPDKNATYNLIGFAVSSPGHYWAYVKRGSKWFKVNCSPEESMEKAASHMDAIFKSGSADGQRPNLFFYEQAVSLPEKLTELSTSLTTLRGKLTTFAGELNQLQTKLLTAKKKS